MVSLDQEIQKDKQKNRQNKPHGKKPIRGRDRRDRPFKSKDRRFPNDKRRGIHKNDRNRNDDRIGRRNRDSRPRLPRRNNDRPIRSDRKQQTREPRIIRRDQNGKRRISRPPRKDSQDKTLQVAQQKGRTLKVMGLHPDFTNQDLYKLFSTQGALQKCLIEQDNFGRSMTTAIVKYHNAQSAKSAIANLNQHKVMNSILTVQPYKNIRR